MLPASNPTGTSPPQIFRKKLDNGGNDLAILKSKFPSIANDCDPTNGIIFGSTENTFDLCRCLWAWGLWGHRLSSWRGISCHLSIHPRSSTSTSTMTCKDFQNLIDLELPDHLPSEVKCDLGVKSGLRRRMAWKHSNEAAGDVTSPLETVRFWVIVVGRTTWWWHENTAFTKTQLMDQLRWVHPPFLAHGKTGASTSCPVLKANQS